MILKLLIKSLLKIHNITYRAIGYLAIMNEPNGLHPKHRITKYHQFFIDNIDIDDYVLDIGCGNGAMTYDMAIKARFVTGIDTDNKQIKKAQSKYQTQNLAFLQGDIDCLGDWHKYNVITLSNVLEHIERPTAFLTSLKKFKPKRILIRVPLLTRDWLTLYKREMGVDSRLDSGHFREYTQNGLSYELKTAGYKIENVEIRYGELFACCTVA